MATLLDIKQEVAAYFQLENGITDLTVNGFDLFLSAANQVRRKTEQEFDFEFSRKLVSVSVNGVTGGDIGTAVLYSDGTTAVTVKTVIEAGMFDGSGNLHPAEWTTVAEGLQRQYSEDRYTNIPRYPTDAWFSGDICGQPRFQFAGSKIFRFPRDPVNNYTVGMEVYSFASDWTSNDYGFPEATVTGGTGVTTLNATYNGGSFGQYNSKPLWLNCPTGGDASGTTKYVIYYNGSAWIIAAIADIGVTTPTNYHSLTSTADTPAGSYTGHGTFTGTAVVTVADVLGPTSDVWTTNGYEFLKWATIVQLNHVFKAFVYRQEGNLPPPEKLRDSALESFKMWDSAQYEIFRRHGR